MASPVSSLPAAAGSYLKRSSDLIVAGLIIGIVLLIIIPLSPGVLDLLLTLSITLGMVVLLITMFTIEPLQFSVFPTLLLVTTLYRLALNISSTRLILSDAAAGKVIAAFGDFVVGGDYVVGMVVFVIITVIQFVVITNGAGRVAEVGARFTLDAMPGKQMSIDAEFNAGMINEAEARERRKRLQREADFFGAMDGASKFVRGDAIAGIVIIIINILGGFIIGVAQKGMSFTGAVQTYTMLTIGDGLVTQVPALLISTATGVLVTRATSDASFGRDLTRQFLNYPKVWILVAGILLILGLIPAMPNILFLCLAAAAGYLSYGMIRKEKQKAAVEQEKAAVKQAREQRKEPENVFSYFQVDTLEIEIGYNLIPLTNEGQGGDLLQRLAATRRQCASEMGIYVRPIRIRDNLQLKPNAYSFKLRGVEIAGGELMPGHFLAMDPLGQDMEIKGTPTTEPTFGLPAWWVTAEDRDQAEMNGFTVVDCSTVLVTHLTEIIKLHAHELLGRQETKELLDVVKEKNPVVVEELVPDLLTLGEVQKILQNLLKERVPIKDLAGIMEALADGARLSKDPDYLTETARQALSRTICRQYTGEGEKISVITLHPKIEQAIADSIEPTHLGSYPVIEPQMARGILDQLKDQVEKFSLKGLPPVILCSSRSRLPFKRFTERILPNLTVLSLNEIAPGIEVEAVGTVMVD
ncbi:MAG: Flagellar biosynthesis pathway, component FlhA [Pelotomaculum thermopropionicum]|uniref:Flagellar biosynthesis protein FlhA n=1 Tax=Pelotomaculum thermopropionicum TaxID=110500 RepID=A0A117M445_9FIRM|nr:MAG: Flagellar biosynthesis pathway, component FlhA [Pelotomaculum thermopropionicum]